MATAVQVVFGANSTQFQAELAKMEAKTIASSRRLSSIGAGGHFSGGGVVRESAVLLREASRGNFTRMAGSLSILAQYLNGAAGAAAKAVIPARMLSDAYEIAAAKANAAAVAAMRKAEASALAAEADGFESNATIAAADADAAQAAAANQTALALGRKAEAASADAAAQEADNIATVAGVGVLGTLGTVATGVVAALFLAHERVGMLAARLAGLRPPDFDPQPIARQFRSINEISESQRKINDEISETIEKYNSAASAAERLAKAGERQFEHAKKLLDIQKETEFAGLGRNATPDQKMAVEKKYSDKALELQRQKDQQTIAGLIDEKTNLTTEGVAAKRSADSIKVSSSAEDRQAEDRDKGKAEYAQKFLKSRSEDPSVWDRIKNQFAAGFSSDAKAAIAAAGKMNEQTAREWIAQYKRTVQTVADNEEIRKRQEALNKKAGESLSRAAGIGAELPEKQAALAKGQADAKAESDARLNLDRVKLDSDSKSERARGYGLNSQQRVGAYAATAPVLNQLLAGVNRIVLNSTPHQAPSNHPPGDRKPQLGTRPSRTLTHNIPDLRP